MLYETVSYLLCCWSQVCPGFKANEIQIPYDKHHSVLISKMSPKHRQFYQI